MPARCRGGLKNGRNHIMQGCAPPFERLPDARCYAVSGERRPGSEPVARRRDTRRFGEGLARRGGLEPPTPRFVAWCSGPTELPAPATSHLLPLAPVGKSEDRDSCPYRIVIGLVRIATTGNSAGPAAFGTDGCLKPSEDMEGPWPMVPSVRPPRRAPSNPGLARKAAGAWQTT